MQIDKFSSFQLKRFVLWRVENIVEKVENAM